MCKVEHKEGQSDIRHLAREGGNKISLITVSAAVLLVSLDSTSVITALPNMETDLRLSQADLGWVLSAFLLTYSSFRLLSGYLSDLYGYRAVFLNGLIIFTAACLASGVSTSRGLLFAARAIQGGAGAVIATSALSLLADIFENTTERARAMAAYGFASAGGSAVGLLLGGLLASTCGWRWIFLLNIPLGISTYLASRLFLPDGVHIRGGRSLDLAGIITMTLSLTLVTYALLESGRPGERISRTVMLLFGVAILVAFFIRIESRATTPLLPGFLFQVPSFLACCIISILFSAAGTASVFVSLYLQFVRHYEPFRTGIAFLPLSLSMALTSLGPAAKLVALWGIRWPIAGGLLLMATGLIFLGNASIDGSVNTTVLPGLTLMGVGHGIILSPLYVGAMSGVAPHDTGVVSGIIGTTSSIGRVLGLALLVSIAAACTGQLTAEGQPMTVALNVGYHTVFLLAALLAAITAIFCVIALRVR